MTGALGAAAGAAIVFLCIAALLLLTNLVFGVMVLRRIADNANRNYSAKCDVQTSDIDLPTIGEALSCPSPGLRIYIGCVLAKQVTWLVCFYFALRMLPGSLVYNNGLIVKMPGSALLATAITSIPFAFLLAWVELVPKQSRVSSTAKYAVFELILFAAVVSTFLLVVSP